MATINNRMELKAAIEARLALREARTIEFFTDSEYLRNGITAWLREWKARGWRTKKKKAVRNEELWCELDAAAVRHVTRATPETSGVITSLRSKSEN